MFHPHPPNGSPGGGSAMSRALSALGTLGGIAGAILLTPAAYRASKAFIHEFASEAWGEGLAPILTGLLGAVECISIFLLIKLLIVSLGTWALMTMARRFSIG